MDEITFALALVEADVQLNLPAVRVAISGKIGIVNAKDIVDSVIKSLLDPFPLTDLFWKSRKWLVELYILTKISVIKEYRREDH